LAKTVKGWTLGPEIEARNATHQIKKMTKAQLHALRDRLFLNEEIPDEALDADLPPYYRPQPGSAVAEYMAGRRRALGGPLPRRVVRPKVLDAPADATFRDLLGGSGTQAVSTTMAFSRLLRNLIRDPSVGSRIVPIVPDEARTFGLESIISEVRIYATRGTAVHPGRRRIGPQLCRERVGPGPPRGDHRGGGHRPPSPPRPLRMPPGGSRSSPATSSTRCSASSGWATSCGRWPTCAGRGFLLGCTAGRTTLNGEGLQHQDGHSLMLASVVPSVAAYDPAFAYEVATIMEDGIKRITGPDPEDRYWYLTLYNENYPMPGLPTDPARERAGAAGGPSRVCTGSPRPPRSKADSTPPSSFPVRPGRRRSRPGTCSPPTGGSGADTWSVTSYKSLREDALSVDRWNRLHPGTPRRVALVTESLTDGTGPVVAVTDFIRSVPDQVSRWVPRPFSSLGTDGFGRSDTRDALRRFFEVDAAHIVISVLAGLAETGAVPDQVVADAIARYGIDGSTADPWSC